MAFGFDEPDGWRRIRPLTQTDRSLPGCTVCRRFESSPPRPSEADSFRTIGKVRADAGIPCQCSCSCTCPLDIGQRNLQLERLIVISARSVSDATAKPNDSIF